MNLNDDLIKWLRGVLDEDEQAAEEVAESMILDGTGTLIGEHGVVLPSQVVRFFDRHNPTSVQADITAKRTILSSYEIVWDARKDGFDIAESEGADLRLVVKIIASAYSNRPGYREEWRP